MCAFYWDAPSRQYIFNSFNIYYRPDLQKPLIILILLLWQKYKTEELRILSSCLLTQCLKIWIASLLISEVCQSRIIWIVWNRIESWRCAGFEMLRSRVLTSSVSSLLLCYLVFRTSDWQWFQFTTLCADSQGREKSFTGLCLAGLPVLVPVAVSAANWGRSMWQLLKTPSDIICYLKNEQFQRK